MSEYIPWNDSKLDTWLTRFSAGLDAHKATFGVTEEDMDELAAARAAFGDAYTEHRAARNAARAATARKRNCRDAVVRIVRRLARQVDNHTAMTNSIRGIMGLHTKNKGRSTLSVGTEVPAVYLTTVPGRVIVHFGDSPANELRNGKPSWAKGCNIYRKRDGEEVFRLIAFEISSPYVDEVTGPPSGYTYIVRYRGQKAQDLGAQSSPTWIAAGGTMAA